MRVCFETTVEDWAAVKVYAMGRLKSMRKLHRRLQIRLFLFILLFGSILYVLDKNSTVFAIAMFFCAAAFMLSLLNNFKRRSKTYFKQLCQIYRKAFEGRSDKRTFWEISQTDLIISDNGTHTLIPMSHIHQVVLLPQFMFIQYGTLEWGYMPKRLFVEGDCLTFTHHFLATYRTLAYERGVGANIVQDETEYKLAKGN